MSIGNRWRLYTRLDQTLVLALLALALNLLLVRHFADASSALAALLVKTSYQWCLAIVFLFLLQSAGIERGWLYWIGLLQALAGTAILLGIALAVPGRSSLLSRLWQVFNVAMCLILAAGISYRGSRNARPHRWLVLLATLLALGVAANDVTNPNGLRSGTTFGHYLFPELVLLVWLVVTGRLFGERAAMQADHAQGLGRLQAEQALHSELLSRRAVESERKRIASDLHDGVGSQLVNLIATLDPRSQRQQAMAIALEQCLLDLKIMVDSIEGEHDTIVDALARLRYRIQPSLDRLGIQMTWNVQDSDQLGALAPDQVLQLLRISQEALSNVMRHSQASVVEVTCRYVVSNHSLLLEICDNGQGVHATAAGKHTAGKGIRSMRERAAATGASLDFSHPQNDRNGTRLLLLLPLSAQPRSPEVQGTILSFPRGPGKAA
jgi:signal transduction histidine kinase